MYMCKALLLLPVLLICVELSLQYELDYYGILGVKSDAKPNEIKRAFRKQAMKYHPDKNKNPNAEEMFKKINEAHEVLMDKDKRRMYDMRYDDVRGTGSSRSSHTSGPGGFNFNYNNFHNFFDHDGIPRGHHQHQSFFSFDDFFEDSDLGFGDFFGGGDAHGFGSGSSFFGSHFGGRSSEQSYNYQRADPVNHEFHPHRESSHWSSHTHTHCQMEKRLVGNRITTTIRCS